MLRWGMPHYIYESRILKTRSGPVCGVDEAGRGPLAGPVVAAAVILQRGRIPKGLNDSKQLSEEAREALFPQIMGMAVAVGVGEASVGEIDLVNIRQATHLAMARAVRALAVAADFALVDGNDAPALPCPCETIVKGDGGKAFRYEVGLCCKRVTLTDDAEQSLRRSTEALDLAEGLAKRKGCY